MEQVGSELCLTKEYLTIADFKHVWENTQYTQPLTLIRNDHLLQYTVVHFADPRRGSVRYARDVVRVEAVPVRPDAAADQHGHDINTERLHV